MLPEWPVSALDGFAYLLIEMLAVPAAEGLQLACRFVRFGSPGCACLVLELFCVIRLCYEGVYA